MVWSIPDSCASFLSINSPDTATIVGDLEIFLISCDASSPLIPLPKLLSMKIIDGISY